MISKCVAYQVVQAIRDVFPFELYFLIVCAAFLQASKTLKKRKAEEVEAAKADREAKVLKREMRKKGHAVRCLSSTSALNTSAMFAHTLFRFAGVRSNGVVRHGHVVGDCLCRSSQRRARIRSTTSRKKLLPE